METNSILKGDSVLGSSSAAGSKLISSIAMTKPLSSEQQKKRAAMLFGRIFIINFISFVMIFLTFLYLVRCSNT